MFSACVVWNRASVAEVGMFARVPCSVFAPLFTFRPTMVRAPVFRSVNANTRRDSSVLTVPMRTMPGRTNLTT